MEVYGTKPKMFTKAWWGYFWYYYKWHTLAAAFVLTVIITGVVQCATDVKYDLQVDYVVDGILSDEQKTALEQLMCENIGDAGGNGKIDAFVLYLNMAETKDIQMKQAMQTKLFLEQGYSESFVFIASKDYISWLASAEIFEPVSAWAPDAEGDYYASLAGCTALEELGIDTSDLYVAVRKLRKDEDKDFAKAQYENGMKFAQFLVSKR
ncbi:MAG: hypothetical protein PUE13_08205 [Clostridiales bacterium]|nr:hypothetical protein [Clostridiales bacterium]